MGFGLTLPSGGAGGGAGLLAPPTTTNTEDDEFAGSSLNAKWTKTNSATVESYSDKISSAAYFEHAASSSDVNLKQDYANAGNFSTTLCCQLLMTTNFHNVAMTIEDSAGDNLVEIQAIYNSGASFRTVKVDATVFSQVATVAVTPLNYPLIFFHIQRTGNNWDLYYSNDGVVWTKLGATIALTFTVAKLGILFGVGAAAVKNRTVLHWFRRDWLTL